MNETAMSPGTFINGFLFSISRQHPKKAWMYAKGPCMSSTTRVGKRLGCGQSDTKNGGPGQDCFCPGRGIEIVG
jgi:hypothetical protein